MKISVITVCYNSELTLNRALQSVVNQDWPYIEHIVIDGASSDGSLEIIERFRSQLVHIVSEPDNGIYDAMNKGLDLASGDIVCFLNADDHYSHQKVLSQVAKQMTDHNLDALMGDVAFFHPHEPTLLIRRFRSNRFRPDRLSWGWMPAHPALFLRKTVIDRVGRFNTNYRIAGDFEFIVRAFTNQTLHYRHIPEVLVHMQTGGVSTSGLRSKILLNREVLKACRENGLQTNLFKILSKYPRKILEYINK